MILLTAEVNELKANPDRKARGIVIEAELDKGRGPVASILVQKGTLHVGDAVSAGSCYGEIRAMMRAKGVELQPAENDYQESSVFGKRFGNGGGVTAAVLECLKEMDENSKKRHVTGIGLTSIHELMKARYGPDYGLYIESRIGYGTKVFAVFPYRRGSETC